MKEGAPNTPALGQGPYEHDQARVSNTLVPRSDWKRRPGRAHDHPDLSLPTRRSARWPSFSITTRRIPCGTSVIACRRELRGSDPT